MNEILFYAGIVFCVFFFILSIILFFSQHIAATVKYFSKVKTKHKFVKKQNNNICPPQEDTAKLLNKADETELLNFAYGETTILLNADDERTVLLSDNCGESENYDEFN